MDNSLLLSALIAVVALSGFAVAVGLHARKDMQATQRRSNRRQQQLEAELGKLRGCVDDLRQRLAECEQQSQQLVPPQAPASGFNLNRRTQAIRLLRRGDLPDQVAKALSVPRQEVQLLQKVQQLLLSAETQRPEPVAVEEPVTVREAAPRAPLGGPTLFRPPVLR